MIGSILCGIISESIGRVNSLRISSFLTMSFCIGSAYAVNFIMYTAFRFFLGCCVGFIIPISFSMIAETTPIKIRGFALIFIGVFYTSGE